MADLGKNLTEALKNNKLKETEKYLELGVSPNCLVEHGTITPMHLAAGLGLEPVCLLLQHGGDPNVCVQDGTTPLHVAAMWGNSDCVQILLANGGDPFLKDLDGMSAFNLASQYDHREVKEVLLHYMTLLSNAEDQTITPKFTYIRRSMSSNASPQSDLDQDVSPDISFYGTQTKDNYLQQFANRRRSSVYLRSIQGQVNQFFGEGQKTHLIDVTSPDHPYVEPRSEAEPGDASCGQSCEQSENSLNLCLSLSEDEQSTSCDSFVTCDGEDLDTVLKNSESGSYFEKSPDCLNTVIKNPKFSSSASIDRSANNNLSSTKDVTDNRVLYRSRGDKYCKRGPLFMSPDSFAAEAEHKCDYCGCYTVSDSGNEETVCKTCEKLGMELDQMMNERTGCGDSKNTVQRRCLPDVLPEDLRIVESTSNNAFYTKQNPRHTGTHTECLNSGKGHNTSRRVSREESIREAFKELSKQFKRTSLDARVSDTVKDKAENNINTAFIKSETLHMDCSKSNCSESRNSANCGFYNPDLNDSLISTDTSYIKRPIKKAEFHPSDISSITWSNCSSDSQDMLEQGYFESQLVNSVPGFNKEKKRSVRNENLPPDCVEKNKVGMSNKNELAREMNNERFEPGNSQSPKINDLWSEVRASSMRNKKLKQKGVLDTAFYGRNSLGSVVSDASTVEYVYTDKEKGIVLVERHIPSQCGSSGSRRSLDSLFSLNTNEGSVVSVSPKSAQDDLNSSQDTILYEWKDNARIQEPEDSTDDTEYSLSQELLKLDDQTLRSKLADFGDDPGPVTKTTRQAYLRRLSQILNDPEARQLSKKGPDFPPELSAALRGTLDLSEMPQLELKMVSAFQNPNRQRRWREGTLKSSFNYILLDPRITKDLPNRSANMTDLEVFNAFISATFYIGKGKRARPYAHLYEAIKEMKKQTGKASQKVLKIIEIWACGLGVVSLHCFQSVIPVEAYTREACMVDAVGLSHLTNKKRGDYYGVSTTYSMKERRKMGVFLLSKALQIFLAEGERQIAPLDIKSDF